MSKDFNPLNHQYPSVDFALRYPCMWVCNLRALALSHRPLGRFHRIQHKLMKYIKKLLRVQNVHILHMLLEVYKGLQKAARTTTTDQAELVSYSHMFGSIIIEIFSCSSFDNDSVVMKFLRSNQVSHPGDIPWMYYWLSADILSENEFLVECLKCGFKRIFACPQVSSRINFILWGHPIFSDLYGEEEYYSSPMYLLLSSMRSHPLAMYSLEGVSRIVLLGLLFQVLLNYNSDMCILEDHYQDNCVVLVIFIISGLLYKFGQLSDALDSRKDLKVYVSKIWNITDVWIYGLLLIWVICYLRCTASTVGKVALAVAAIPTSLSLMKYLSMQQEFGKLVIMIFGNITHLITFGVIFFTAILGFAISFYGLFRTNESFSSYGNTFLTLFNAAVGNVDFDTFNTTSHRVNLIGQFVMVCYVCTITLVVLNLLIARMASTYDEIQQQSREHWSYAKAETTSEYMLYYERNPCCMLPPPFNLIPTLLSPFHYWYLASTSSIEHTISISGTASNVVLWFLGLIPRVVIIVYSTIEEKIQEVSHKFTNKILPKINRYWMDSTINLVILLILTFLAILVVLPVVLFLFPIFAFLIAPIYYLGQQLVRFVTGDPNIVTIVKPEKQLPGKYLILNGRLESFDTRQDLFGFSPGSGMLHSGGPRTPLRKDSRSISFLSLSQGRINAQSKVMLNKKFTMEYYMLNTSEIHGTYFTEGDIQRIVNKIQRQDQRTDYFHAKITEEIISLKKEIEKKFTSIDPEIISLPIPRRDGPTKGPRFSKPVLSVSGDHEAAVDRGDDGDDSDQNSSDQPHGIEPNREGITSEDLLRAPSSSPAYPPPLHSTPSPPQADHLHDIKQLLQSHLLSQSHLMTSMQQEIQKLQGEIHQLKTELSIRNAGD